MNKKKMKKGNKKLKKSKKEKMNEKIIYKMKMIE